MASPIYLHLPAGRTPPSLEEYLPFKAVLVIEQPSTCEWRSAVADWLVEGGCLFAMAWGQDGLLWEDSVDEANLSAFNFEDIPDDAFVLTTCHADEPLSETFWFAAHAASHSTVALDLTVIVHISSEARKEELLRAYEVAAKA